MAEPRDTSPLPRDARDDLETLCAGLAWELELCEEDARLLLEALVPAEPDTAETEGGN